MHLISITQPLQQGTLTCDGCGVVLLGYDSFFTHCNPCSNKLIQPVEEGKGYCSCHPGCGCQHPDECTNRHNP